MKIALVNIDLYRYEIHSLIKAFFPEEEVKVLPAGEGEAEPFLFVTFEEKRISIRMNRREERIARAPEGTAFNEKGRACKTALKHLLYELLSELTGRTLPWGELIGVRPTKIAMQQLLVGEDAAQYLMREHLVSKEKACLAAEIAQREREILSGIHYENGYSLYVGIPFCPTTCLYCSFPSYSIAGFADQVEAYLSALEKEIAETAKLMRQQGQILDTIYIGGGTPTTLTPEQSDRLLSCIEEYFLSGEGAMGHGLQEFTVEAGRPDSITKKKLKVLKGHGVSRISVNPQTMKDETLRMIGRRHSVQDVRDAFYLARETGFDNINMDLILGLPEETEEDVERTIAAVEELSPDSLTVHSLALKRGSRMQEWIAQNGWTSIRNTDKAMHIAAEGAARMGMEPYYLYRQKNMSGNFENVGYARPGTAPRWPGKAGLYNILIMEEKQSILALGAGSISKRVIPDESQPSGSRIARTDNAKDIATYISRIDEMIDRKRALYC